MDVQRGLGGWAVAVGQVWCHKTLLCSNRVASKRIYEHPRYETRNIKGKLLSVDYLGPS